MRLGIAESTLRERLEAVRYVGYFEMDEKFNNVNRNVLISFIKNIFNKMFLPGRI